MSDLDTYVRLERLSDHNGTVTAFLRAALCAYSTQRKMCHPDDCEGCFLRTSQRAVDERQQRHFDSKLTDFLRHDKKRRERHASG